MWVDHTLKCPDHEDWLTVLRVTPDGEVTLVAYLTAIPEDAEQELGALQQRWRQRETWPKDAEIQEGARVRPYFKYPEEAPAAREAPSDR